MKVSESPSPIEWWDARIRTDLSASCSNNARISGDCAASIGFANSLAKMRYRGSLYADRQKRMTLLDAGKSGAPIIDGGASFHMRRHHKMNRITLIGEPKRSVQEIQEGAGQSMVRGQEVVRS